MQGLSRGVPNRAQFWTHRGPCPILCFGVELSVLGPKKWRDDERCGHGYLAEDGNPAECNPDGIHPCCSAHKWCGNTAAHCDCSACVDYRDSDTTVCESLTTDTGTFTSPNYPNNYPNDLTCRYEISVTPPKVIRLTFTELDLEDGHDWVYVYDGSTTYPAGEKPKILL
ncbi:blastula protease 10-like [Branchiostoma floridae]|uniref:Blastula protease 10-like n=1 Tax=Branchiostoma floridae TaxID=7739 RepID=A0A9J7HXN4_BRAFL|nr:blastula protease 10-like [Branchiostoma floridae]